MNMPLNFGQKIEEKSNDVIPKDTLLWGVIKIREMKRSQETNGRYMDIEITVADNQPYARRKIWVKIADPFDTNNSEAWRTMGYGEIRRILEAVKGATPDNPNSYALNRLEDLHGLMVPMLIGIEKGSTQYPDDKNRVEFLSPHSSVKKIVECFRLLSSGVFQYGKPAAPAAPQQGSMFAGTANPPPANMPLATPAATAPAQGPGWLAPPAPVGNAPAQPATHQPAMTPPQAQNAGPAAPTAAYPSNQGFQQPAAHPPQSQPAPANAGPQPQPSTNMAPPAIPASASPSNPAWPAPGGVPAQFPGGQNTGHQ